MKNAVGRDIPDFLLQNGREVYQGKNYMDGKYLQKASPRTRRYEKPQESKLVDSIADALRQLGAKSGMTFSFHHHLRDGDYVVNMVMKAAIEELGLEDLTIAASSLGAAHDPIADYIEQGKVVGIQTSGIRGRMGEVVSAGKLKTPAIIRSHGGRPRAIEAGEVHIDFAFVAAPTSDCVGNCRGIGGKSNCGSMGYAMTDAKYADHVVVVTDCLVDFPNMPASVEAIDVDAVVVVDSIGNPKKIASAAARISQNPRDLMMAENVAKVIASTPYFKEGFSFQTGVGGPSLAANLFLEKFMDERNIKMGWAIGGICGPMVEMLKKGKVGKVIDVQDFDLDAVNSINQTPNHFEMSASQYANPANKGAFVNKLDRPRRASRHGGGQQSLHHRHAPHPGAHGHGVRARGHGHHARRLRGRSGHGLRYRREPPAARSHRMPGQGRHPPRVHRVPQGKGVQPRRSSRRSRVGGQGGGRAGSPGRHHPGRGPQDQALHIELTVYTYLPEKETGGSIIYE